MVNFTIGADHRGGSCQFSVTYEDINTNPDKLKWKPIYSIIGGCPSQSSNAVPAYQNLPVLSEDQDKRQAIRNCGNDTGLDCIRNFTIPFPRGMPNGNATLAWTSFILWAIGRFTCKSEILTSLHLTALRNKHAYVNIFEGTVPYRRDWRR